MKKFAMLFVILTFVSVLFGQQNHFRYKAAELKDDVHEFSFPVFSNSNRFASDKVNQMLQIAELEILKGFEKKHIFEEVYVDRGGIYGGKVGIAFKIYDNNSRILSVMLDESSCGATCHYWVKYYNFNSGNGDLIQLKDLFTEKGFEKFFAFATKRRIRQLKNEIRKLPPAERGDYEGIAGTYESDDLTDFYIRNNVLYIDGENSFNKGQKFSSVEIKRISRFNVLEFKEHLNDYGKSVFGLNGNSIKKYRSNILPQLFEGKIGKQKVVMVLNTDYENQMKAEYVYAKYGTGIFLDGALDKTTLTFTEKLRQVRPNGFVDYVDNGTIRANYDGQSIVGKWMSKDETKIYELRLSRK